MKNNDISGGKPLFHRSPALWKLLSVDAFFCLRQAAGMAALRPLFALGYVSGVLNMQ